MQNLTMAMKLFWDQVAGGQPNRCRTLRPVLKELIDWTGRYPELRLAWDERPDDGKRVMKFCLAGRSVSFWAAWPREGYDARLTLLGSGHPTYPEELREFARQELTRIAGRQIGQIPQLSFRTLVDPEKRKQVKRLMTRLFCRLTGRTEESARKPHPDPAVRVPDRSEFHDKLESQFAAATSQGWSFIETDSFLLHAAVSCPACAESLSACCEVMITAMLPEDKRLVSPARWFGTPMAAVRYLLPRRTPALTVTAVPSPEPVPAPSQEYQPTDEDSRTRVLRKAVERPGQGEFRTALVERYGRRCLVTGCGVLAALEAAHISPWRGEDDNNPENGLLLRADIHTLFDHDLLGIEPKHLRVEVHPSLAGDYGHLAGKRLLAPTDQGPSTTALALRYRRFCERLHTQ